MYAKQLGQEIAPKEIRIEHDYPAANTIAQLAWTGPPTWGARVPVIAQIIWSYSAVPASGRLTVIQDTTTFLDIDIRKGGPGSVDLNIRTRDTKFGFYTIVELAAGGVGVMGKLHVIWYLE